ncbi:MAG: hypothetical protein GWN08_01410, partial [Gemmatimonadetes bacterium]|nr:hypothetical protein [Gemmatimonadota bacterium]
MKRPTPRPQKPIPPKPDFTYLGYLGPKDNRIAVFDLGEEEPILAQAGDVIAEAFTVVEFKYQSVVLGFTDERFKDETTELEMKN